MQNNSSTSYSPQWTKYSVPQFTNTLFYFPDIS